MIDEKRFNAEHPHQTPLCEELTNLAIAISRVRSRENQLPERRLMSPGRADWRVEITPAQPSIEEPPEQTDWKYLVSFSDRLQQLHAKNFRITNEEPPPGGDPLDDPDPYY